MKNLKIAFSVLICTVFMLTMAITTWADEVANSADTETTTTETPEVTETLNEEVSEAPEALETSNVEAPEVTETPEIEVPVITTELVPFDNATIVINGAILDIPSNYGKVMNGSGRTYLPLRAVAEALNCEVAWRAGDRTVHIFKNGETKVLAIDSTEMKQYDFVVDSSLIYTKEEDVAVIGMPPQIKDGRTYLPLRALIEDVLGYKDAVDWAPETATVTINTPVEAQAYRSTMTDKFARTAIETYGYYPQLQGGTVHIVLKNVAGNDAVSADGISVTLADKEVKTANGGKASFSGIPIGEYELAFSGAPDGYAVTGDTKIIITANGDKKDIELNIAVASATVVFSVVPNYEGGRIETLKDVSVKFGEETKAIDETGKCTFEDVKLGEYKIEVLNIPEGLKLKDETALNINVEAGKTNNIIVYLEKDTNK